MPRAVAIPLVAAIAALLAACATVPAAAPGAAAPDAPFAVEGRLSARRGVDGVAGNFVWTHDRSGDVIALATPLGQTMAKLSGGDGRARVELADGAVAEAADWESLTLRTLSVPLPVAGLAWWIRGVPHPRSTNTVEVDALGRAMVLRQDGWEVVYAYADAAARAASRVRLAWPDVDVRLVIDRWQ
ncbi:MAG: lipoprotein insertase outer membrane protein LolB [Betaproteobacteria bacterium]